MTIMDRYLRGELLYGDDFSPNELMKWYEIEANAYADSYEDVVAEHEYRCWLRRYGIGKIPHNRLFDHTLGYGAGLGSELVEHQHRIGQVTIVDSSASYATPTSHLKVPAKFVQAQPSGEIAIADSCADLITCLGTLHHVANVSHVVREFARILKPGAYAVVREPIISMGDWKNARKGLTPNERGIPLHLLQEICERAGFLIVSKTLVGFPLVPRIGRALRMRCSFNSPTLTAIDKGLCIATRWNYRYHAETLLEKLRPTSAVFVMSKPVIGG